MIKILVFVFGVLVSIEYLVYIEMELWQTSFCQILCASCLVFSTQKNQTVSDDIDDFFSRLSQKNK